MLTCNDWDHQMLQVKIFSPFPLTDSGTEDSCRGGCGPFLKKIGRDMPCFGILVTWWRLTWCTFPENPILDQYFQCWGGGEGE